MFFIVLCVLCFVDLFSADWSAYTGCHPSMAILHMEDRHLDWLEFFPWVIQWTFVNTYGLSPLYYSECLTRVITYQILTVFFLQELEFDFSLKYVFMQ